MLLQQDLNFIKYGIVIGILVLIIRELVKAIFYLWTHKKNGTEVRCKEESRIKIHDMHEIVTAKNDGVPLIYNKGLEKAIVELTSAIRNNVNN